MPGADGATRDMRVLVTGAAGFIGSHVCERLCAGGHGVWGLDNFDPFYDPDIKRRNVSQVTKHPCFHLVEGDLRDDVLLEGLVASVPFDLVVHLAGRPGVRPSITQPELCYDVNVTGTLRLLEALRRHRATRLIFASSSSVYGERTVSGGAFVETDPAFHPVSPYAASKRSGELLCHAWHHLWGMSIHCLRLFTVYGPRQRPDLAINKFVRLMRSGERIPMYGDGSSARDYTYVGDVVEAIVRSADRLQRLPAANPEYDIFNVGSGRPVSLSELIDTLARLLEVKAKVVKKPDQPGDVPLTLADTAHLRDVLDVPPVTPLETGLGAFIDWTTDTGGVETDRARDTARI